MHLGKARARLAACAASRRLGSRPERAAYDDARECTAARGRVRFPAFSPGLLSVLAVLAPAHAVRHDAARPARSSRTSAGVRHVLLGAGRVDLQFAAPADSAGALDQDDSPRTAGAIAA